MSRVPEPSRRETLTGLAGVAASGVVSRSVRASDRPPNVVFILIDDLRWNWLGCMGHPWIPTPNIDRIAKRGVAFDNAFVAISICSPSRATLLTGCHPQRTGVFLNSIQGLHPDVPTWGQVLQGAGYETAMVGKWHLPPYNRVRDGWELWYSFRGQGVYEDPEFFNGERFHQRRGYMTDLLTDRAVAWLERRSGKRPFALLLSHKGVHGTPVPATRHAKAFPHERNAEPVSWSDDLAGKPAYQRAHVAWGSKKAQWDAAVAAGKTIPKSLASRPWQPRNKIHLDTARVLLGVDESVGRVLDTLEARGQLDDTVVVFTSDNGVLLGEHGFLPGGKQLLYEESVRIPLVVQGPGFARGLRSSAMVSALDLAPTLFDLAGVKDPPRVHGRSLRPLLNRPLRSPQDWRNHLLLQHFMDPRWPSRPDMRGVRTPRHKLVVSPAHEDGLELYDLKKDPHELVNLARLPGREKLIEDLQSTLQTSLAEVEADRLPPV